MPNENPARGAVKKPPEVQEFDAVNVHRPTMLALTTVRENAVSPEVFIQRAFKIDREHWMEIESTKKRGGNWMYFLLMFANLPGCLEVLSNVTSIR